MNKCLFLGNLTKDPELRNVGAKGTAVTNFTIAVSRRFKRVNGETTKEVVFIECEAWDSGAETIVKYLKKGDPIIVFCSAKMEQWEKDGVKHSKIRFRVDEFEFVPSRRNNKSENAPHTDNNVPVDDNDEAVPF